MTIPARTRLPFDNTPRGLASGIPVHARSAERRRREGVRFMELRLRTLMLCVLAVALSACGGSEEGEAEGAQRGAPPPVTVVVEEAAPGVEMPSDIILPGRVQAVTQAELSFQVDGRLRAFAVAEGARVEAGGVIAELDDTDYRVQLRQAQTVEETASADLARRRVLNREGILARAAVEEAEANVAQARAERENAERQVAYTRLTAPYDGTIGRRLVETGTVIGAGEPVVTMVDGEAVDVSVDVPAAEAVRLPFGPALAGTGVVVGIGEDIEIELAYAEHATVPDEQSRTYRLVMRGVPPPGINLLPGMAVRVTLPDPSPTEVAQGELLVPLSAILSAPGDGAAIFVVDEEERARRVAVEMISAQGERALVRGDLGEGARVVVSGGQHLADGQAVRPQTRD